MAMCVYAYELGSESEKPKGLLPSCTFTSQNLEVQFIFCHDPFPTQDNINSTDNNRKHHNGLSQGLITIMSIY